jgi:hypothetical protein
MLPELSPEGFCTGIELIAGTMVVAVAIPKQTRRKWKQWTEPWVPEEEDARFQWYAVQLHAGDIM